MSFLIQSDVKFIGGNSHSERNLMLFEDNLLQPSQKELHFKSEILSQEFVNDFKDLCFKLLTNFQKNNQKFQGKLVKRKSLYSLIKIMTSTFHATVDDVCLKLIKQQQTHLSSFIKHMVENYSKVMLEMLKMIVDFQKKTARMQEQLASSGRDNSKNEQIVRLKQKLIMQDEYDRLAKDKQIFIKQIEGILKNKEKASMLKQSNSADKNGQVLKQLFKSKQLIDNIIQIQTVQSSISQSSALESNNKMISIQKNYIDMQRLKLLQFYQQLRRLIKIKPQLISVGINSNLNNFKEQVQLQQYKRKIQQLEIKLIMAEKTKSRKPDKDSQQMVFFKKDGSSAKFQQLRQQLQQEKDRNKSLQNRIKDLLAKVNRSNLVSVSVGDFKTFANKQTMDWVIHRNKKIQTTREFKFQVQRLIQVKVLGRGSQASMNKPDSIQEMAEYSNSKGRNSSIQGGVQQQISSHSLVLQSSRRSQIDQEFNSKEKLTSMGQLLFQQRKFQKNININQPTKQLSNKIFKQARRKTKMHIFKETSRSRVSIEQESKVPQQTQGQLKQQKKSQKHLKSEKSESSLKRNQSKSNFINMMKISKASFKPPDLQKKQQIQYKQYMQKKAQEALIKSDSSLSQERQRVMQVNPDYKPMLNYFPDLDEDYSSQKERAKIIFQKEIQKQKILLKEKRVTIKLNNNNQINSIAQENVSSIAQEVNPLNQVIRLVQLITLSQDQKQQQMLEEYLLNYLGVNKQQQSQRAIVQQNKKNRVNQQVKSDKKILKPIQSKSKSKGKKANQGLHLLSRRSTSLIKRSKFKLIDFQPQLRQQQEELQRIQRDRDRVNEFYMIQKKLRQKDEGLRHHLATLSKFRPFKQAQSRVSLYFQNKFDK